MTQSGIGNGIKMSAQPHTSHGDFQGRGIRCASFILKNLNSSYSVTQQSANSTFSVMGSQVGYSRYRTTRIRKSLLGWAERSNLLGVEGTEPLSVFPAIRQHLLSQNAVPMRFHAISYWAYVLVFSLATVTACTSPKKDVPTSKETNSIANKSLSKQTTDTPKPIISAKTSSPNRQSSDDGTRTTSEHTASVPPDSLVMQPEKATKVSPEKYLVRLESTKGDILIDVFRSWAPLAANRFYNLVEADFYTDVAFFRVIKGFMAQTGISGIPAVNRVWAPYRIADDPVSQSNTRGMVSFAMSGKNSRTTQIFINYGDNSRLDSMGFVPFGKVRDMSVVDALYSEYGESYPRGRGPQQVRIQNEGNVYLRSEFTQLDYIKKATIGQ